MVTDPRIALWTRLVVLAYRDADAESETLYLDPGELAERVGHTGNRAVLSRAVERAMELGFLAKPSGTTALRLAPCEGD